MITTQLAYAAPTNLDEALAILQAETGAMVLGGGTTLVTEMKLGRLTPSTVVDLRNIPELQGIQESSDGLTIGAMTTVADLGRNPMVQERYRVLAEAIAVNGDPQERNMATLGGSIARRIGRIAAAALALDAAVGVRGRAGMRQFAYDDLLGLEAGEVLTAVGLPASVQYSGSSYEEMPNPADGSALCGVAARVVLGADGAVQDCRVAMTSGSSRVMRLPLVESALRGSVPDTERMAAVAARADDSVPFSTDHWASSEYKAHLLRVFLARAVTRAAEQAAVDR